MMIQFYLPFDDVINSYPFNSSGLQSSLNGILSILKLLQLYSLTI
jgi:hypothetical protein